MTAPRWTDVQRILCVRLDNLGDVLMTSPALRAIRASLPGSRITLLASAAGAAAARFLPEVDEAIMYPAPWMKDPAASAESVLPLAQRLRRRRFDAAVIFTVYSQSPLPAALLCAAAGIPLRLAHCRENPYQLLTDWVPESEPQGGVRHEVQRQLDLVAHLGFHTSNSRLSFSIPPRTSAAVSQRLRLLGIDPASDWFLIHPGASAPARRYPPELWAQAAQQLALEHRCPVVFVGSAHETELIAAIRAGMATPSLALCGELDLGGLAACIALAPVLLCNNSGPAHIAAATGTPVVDLYALTNPQHTPWQVPHSVLFHDVPCRFCYRSVCPQGHHACLRQVDPGVVAAAATELLAARAAGCPSSPYTRTVPEILNVPAPYRAAAMA